MAETGVVLSTAQVKGLLTDDQSLHRWRLSRSLLGLTAVSVGMVQQLPHPVSSGRGIAVLACILAGAAAWLAMTLRVGGPRSPAWSLGACGGCGVLLMGLAPHAYGQFYVVAAALIAPTRLPVRAATALTSGLVLAQSAVLFLVPARHADLTGIAVWAGVIYFMLLLGVIRQQREQQAMQTKALAAETELTRQEQARAAALAERARLAREIHDVLAHSLSALSVQLEAAAALLERDRTAEAATAVDRAGRMARDGLAETRRAVGALRGDPLPLPELVAALADGAAVEVTGEPRALSAETGLALYRSALEALTNARKHAPGAAVRIRLDYLPASVELTVANDSPAGPPPAARLPSGYGLTGLRERAELAGGAFAAGPVGGGWRVDVKMPG